MGLSYHISPNGPRMCRAKKGGCPYARAGQPHFDTASEAQEVYESKMAETFGLTRKIFREEKDGGIIGKINRQRQLIYRDIDDLRKVTRKVTSGVVNSKNAVIASVSREARASYKQYLLGDIPEKAQAFKRNHLTFKKKMLQFVAKSSKKLNDQAQAALDAKYSTKKYKNFGANNVYASNTLIGKQKRVRNTL